MTPSVENARGGEAESEVTALDVREPAHIFH